MTSAIDTLFRPFHSANLTLPNRIVMAPMTRSFSPGGVPGEDVAAYYARRAKAGVGLIVTEGTLIADPAAGNDEKVPRFHGADALAGWAKVVAAVKAVGGKIAPQLWHVGTMRKAGQGPNPEAPPVSPSGLFRSGKPSGHALSDSEVADIIAAYAQGAADAQRLGFDAVELHGAHGYLIDQFFWADTNHRHDIYGGDMVARTRFATEIVKACRAKVGPNFSIILRFSQWKQQDYAAKLAPDAQALDAFLAPLTQAGVDIFHCSTRRFWEPEFDGSNLNLAGWTRKLTGKPTITVGSVSLSQEFVATFQGQSAKPASLDELLLRLAADEFDLVAVGRALLVDPDWVEKVKAGRFDDLKPYAPEALAQLF